jgi:hypothetical protein
LCRHDVSTSGELRGVRAKRGTSRHTGFEDCSSSIVTATAAFAERRTFWPSTSATKLRSIK